MRLLTGFEGMPYCDLDLRNQFADRYDLRRVETPTGTEWTARRLGVTGALVHAADSPAELARELRMMH